MLGKVSWSSNRLVGVLGHTSMFGCVVWRPVCVTTVRWFRLWSSRAGVPNESYQAKFSNECGQAKERPKLKFPRQPHGQILRENSCTTQPKRKNRYFALLERLFHKGPAQGRAGPRPGPGGTPPSPGSEPAKSREP